MSEVLITREGLQQLLDELSSRGYEILGPTLRDGAIVYEQVTRIDELPRGLTDQQAPGSYRLEKRGDDALFGYAVGPQSWKRFVHPPLQHLWRMRRDGASLSVAEETHDAKKLAFFGARACEIHALAIQDRVFTAGPFHDEAYRQRRKNNFVVAVNCGTAGGTCFCVSMRTGPKVERGFDLALTELLGDVTVYLVEIGSELGNEVLMRVASRPAGTREIAAAAAVTANTAANMGRSLQTNGLKQLLQANPEHPRWDDIATRCLSCSNCTSVCPTCFCTTVEDHTDLAGTTATRERKWDSCFTLDFSYVHDAAVRKQTRSRYRHWMTHKLASWIDQFGQSGCVGCGRCITWCPVGIDITAEAAVIRGSDST